LSKHPFLGPLCCILYTACGISYIIGVHWMFGGA
jgi:hypothetical protein